MPKPELGKLTVGQRVLVLPEPRNSYDVQEPINAEITKVGRAWVEMRPVTGHGFWRMRIDSQNQATGYGYGGDRFVTPEQHAWERRMRAARKVLSAAGIYPECGSAWLDDERTLALAEFVQRYEVEHANERTEA